VALAVPAAGGPGVWRLAGFRERQSYAITSTPSQVIREDRRRTALSVSDWLGPDCRAEIGAALDAWSDRGAHLSLEGSIETRWLRDRLALAGTMARWVSLEAGPPFGAGDLSAKWSSGGLQRCDAWLGVLGISAATSRAPLALWSGAGTGYGRAPLLRAHPLLSDDGIVRSGAFGRTLVHGTVERQTWPWMLGPLQLGCALFLDGARPWGGGADGRDWQVDGGAGLRLRVLGGTGRFRIDAARGLVDGSSAVSVAWQVR
jgi:hypothetical protein